MAKLASIGLVFIPSKDGISHSSQRMFLTYKNGQGSQCDAAHGVVVG
jgi:hypothetical protein